MDMWKILKEVSKKDDKSIVKLKDQNKTAPCQMASWGVCDYKILENCMVCESLQVFFCREAYFCASKILRVNCQITSAVHKI